MQPITTVPVGSLLGPIAAATVLNLFLFAWIWRADKIEIRGGNSPWWAGVIFLSYFAFIFLFAYYLSAYPARNLASIFWAALIAEAIGGAVTYGLVYSFIISRTKPFRDRIFAMVVSLAVLAAVIGATFFQVSN
ncbi:hypothetical protein [Methylobacterium frigidaeris]|uniref:hypothetical protein n=1 Tax=Methylobacterium frigidaeris TaxID=2038277 RepID=UPI001056046D|nr:hypothetical protein [Methylobacterium frigidaeris]